jgi:hypothetical protein
MVLKTETVAVDISVVVKLVVAVAVSVLVTLLVAVAVSIFVAVSMPVENIGAEIDGLGSVAFSPPCPKGR